MKKVFIGTGICTALLLAIIIGNNTSNQTASVLDAVDKSLVEITFADLPVLHSLPLYYAVERGYFTEVGIDAKIQQFDSPNLIIDALLSGAVDITSPSGAMGIAGVAENKQPGSLYVYMGSGGTQQVPNDSLLVGNDSTISSFADMSGYTLGILPGIQWRTIATELLGAHNLTVGTDVFLAELAPGLQGQALASGQIDALLGVQPLPTVVTQKDLGYVVEETPTADAIANPFYAGAGVVRTDFANENPELIQTILSVLNKSIAEIYADPEAARQYLSGYTPLDDSLIAEAPIMHWTLTPNMTERDIQAIEDFHAIFYKHGVVESPIPTRSMLYGR